MTTERECDHDTNEEQELQQDLTPPPPPPTECNATQVSKQKQSKGNEPLPGGSRFTQTLLKTTDDEDNEDVHFGVFQGFRRTTLKLGRWLNCSTFLLTKFRGLTSNVT